MQDGPLVCDIFDWVNQRRGMARSSSVVTRTHSTEVSLGMVVYCECVAGRASLATQLRDPRERIGHILIERGRINKKRVKLIRGHLLVILVAFISVRNVDLNGRDRCQKSADRHCILGVLIIEPNSGFTAGGTGMFKDAKPISTL